MKRPCDGTSGLLRGNRRKAVFAFKGLFFGKDFVALSCLEHLVLSYHPEVCGKFRNPRAHRLYRTKKPQVDALELLGVVDLSCFCRILLVLAILVVDRLPKQFD